MKDANLFWYALAGYLLYRASQESSSAHVGAVPAVEFGSMAELLQWTLGNKTPQKGFVRLGRLPAIHAQAVRQLTGKDVSGYECMVDSFQINHILNKHGNPAKEASRGQVAVTPTDLLNFRAIIMDPDSIEDAGLDRKGLQTVRFVKRLTDRVFATLEIRTGSKVLTPVTLYKRKIG